MIIGQGSLASGSKAPQSTEVFHLITDCVLLKGAVLKLNTILENNVFSLIYVSI